MTDVNYNEKDQSDDEEETYKEKESPETKTKGFYEPFDENDPQFKSFEKFAKFVEMEELMFTEDQFEEIKIMERSSVTSAIYSYEYGNGFQNRRWEIIEPSKEKSILQRSKSVDVQTKPARSGAIPRNINKLKLDIKKKSERPDSSRKNEPHLNLFTEKRNSDFMESKEDTPGNKINREEWLKDHSLDVEDDFEDYLEGMKDPFNKDWSKVEAEMKKKSIYKDFRTYKLRSLIFKSNDDLRQELLAIQLIKRLKRIFDEENLALYLHPYEIIITSHSSGYMECIQNS